MREQTQKPYSESADECALRLSMQLAESQSYNNCAFDAAMTERLKRVAAEEEIATLSARCTALEQEHKERLIRQQQAHHAEVQEVTAALQSRCQHLEQAVKEVAVLTQQAWRACGDSRESLIEQTLRRLGIDPYGSVVALDAEEHDIERAEFIPALLSSQDETNDQTRASFSAGYTQALTDITGAQ